LQLALKKVDTILDRKLSKFLDSCFYPKLEVDGKPVGESLQSPRPHRRTHVRMQRQADNART